MKREPILPRVLRYRDAPGYLGMCRQEFDKTVRPFVTEFPIGAQGVGFDRYEIDAWTDAYIAENATQKAPRAPSRSAKRELEKQAAEKSRREFEDALRLVGRKK